MLNITILKDDSLRRKWWQFWIKKYEIIDCENLNIKIYISYMNELNNSEVINFYNNNSLKRDISLKLLWSYCNFYGIDKNKEVLTYISENISNVDEKNLKVLANEFKGIRLITNDSANGSVIADKLYREFGILVEVANDLKSVNGISFPLNYRISCPKIDELIKDRISGEILEKLYEFLFAKGVLKAEDFEYSLT